MTSITGPGVDDEEDTTNVGGGGGDVEGSRKIERKRTRERQRRSDLASAFVELTALVSQLDPASAVDEPDAVGTNNKRRRRRSIGSDPDEIVGTSAARPDLDNSSMTRLDLIGRTTNLLRRLQRDNADLRRCLNEERNRTGEDDNVSRQYCTYASRLSIFA